MKTKTIFLYSRKTEWIEKLLNVWTVHSPFLTDKLSISDLGFQKKSIRKTKNILMYRLTNLLFKTFWSLDNVFFSSHQMYCNGGKKENSFSQIIDREYCWGMRKMKTAEIGLLGSCISGMNNNTDIQLFLKVKLSFNFRFCNIQNIL